MEVLTPEQIRHLLHRPTSSGESLFPSTDPHHLPSVDDSDSPETYFCVHCGHCEDPSTCVYGIQCPECCAPPHQQCTNANGGLAGIHEARHKYSNSSWWKEYRG